MTAGMLITLLFHVALLRAQDQIVALSEEAIFQRCYGQIVRQRAARSHALLAQVRAGSISAVDACMSLLAKANLLRQGSSLAYQLANVNDSESKAILKTFHDFHRGWIDSAQPPDNVYAGFFTNALFGPDVPYSSVVKENRGLRALRNVGNFVDDEGGTSHALQQGEIVGLEFYPVDNSSWWSRTNVEQQTVTALYGGPTFRSKRSYGGGILGLQTFIWGHVGYPFMRDKADGAVRIPRRWAKQAFSTLLCREIPQLRTSDVSDLVASYKEKFPNEAAHVAFRPNSNCMSCHAALDPLGAALRNVTFVRTDQNSDTDRQAHILVVRDQPTSASELEGLHLVHADANFYRRPPNSMIYYRNYQGELVKESISANSIEESLSKVGNSFANKDDFYMCAASRYFHFFTGIKTNLLDYKDVRNGGQITDADLHYRKLVKELADSLKNDPKQSIKSLIRKIVSLPLYRSEGMRDPK
jgi:hypothetical protein